MDNEVRKLIQENERKIEESFKRQQRDNIIYYVIQFAVCISLAIAVYLFLT